MDHANHPRTIGVIEDADGIDEVGNPGCGGMMTFPVKVKDNRLEGTKQNTKKQVPETLGSLPPISCIAPI